MSDFRLPEDFLLGTATAGTQIEGGDMRNTWYKWCQEGHIKDGSSCFTANDHWNRVEEDVSLLVQLKVQTHRMGLEWSRIEPSPGNYSNEAIRHYKYEISLLIKNGIKPMVTLHHFSDPLWFIEKGGWKKAENIKLFIEYVDFVINELGDLVSDWVTFNEPNVYAEMGYRFGIFPPGERSLLSSFKVQANIQRAHTEAYSLIHKIRGERDFPGETLVGTAMHLRIFEGMTPAGKKIAGFVDYMFNQLLMEGTIKGKLHFPLNFWGSGQKAGSYSDFIGINYYTRNIVEFTLNPLNWFHNLINDERLDKADNGWDIYPEGLYDVCRRFYDKYRLPIFITENGIDDRNDKKRPDFIMNHIRWIIRAINDGIPVQRYYHWTLMDNFEWISGESANFGLYDCDFTTQERIQRKSGALYSFICSHKSENIL